MEQHSAYSVRYKLKKLRERRFFCKLFKSPNNYRLVYNYVNKVGNLSGSKRAVPIMYFTDFRNLKIYTCASSYTKVCKIKY